MDSTQQYYISKAYDFTLRYTYIYILNHPSNVVAQLTKMCRPVGCCSVRLSPSRLSPSWFVAQMTVHRVYCPIVARQLYSVQYTILQLLPYLTLPVVNLFWLASRDVRNGFFKFGSVSVRFLKNRRFGSFFL